MPGCFEATGRASTPSRSAPCFCRVINLRFELDEGGCRALASKSDDDVPGQEAIVDEFSRDGAGSPPKGVANYRIPAPRGDDNTHPIEFGWAAVHNEVLRDSLVPAANHLTKIAGLDDAVVAWKQRQGLNGDFAAALAATGGEDRSAGTRAHAQTKTVNLRTAAVVGLVGTLRHLFSSAIGRHSQGVRLRTDAQPPKNTAHCGCSQTHQRSVFHISVTTDCVVRFVANMVTYPQAGKADAKQRQPSRKPMAQCRP